MAYIPVFLRVRDLECLVVGGGSVALRKIKALVDAGISVRVVSPEVNRGIDQLSSQGRVKVDRRRFEDGDLDGVRFVIAATDEPSVNQRISMGAKLRGVLCNVVDQPDLSDAIMPSVIRRGRLQVAISTGGGTPAMARWMRIRLSRIIGKEYGLATEILSIVRKKVLSQRGMRHDAGGLSYELLKSGFIRACRRGDLEEIRDLIEKLSGIKISVEEMRDSANDVRSST